jgi:hypothetical protein
MRYPMPLVVLLAAGARAEDARPFNSADYPPGVQKSLRAARTIRFDLHGSFCGGFGAQACVKEKTISTRPFEFKKP